MAEGESKVKQVLSILWSYLYSSLPPTEDFIIQLEIGGLIAKNDATKLRASARLGSTSCIHDLITYMYQFFDEPAFETFCTILDKYGRSARPLLLEVAVRIREEIGLKPPQVHVPAPEDPQKGTSKPIGLMLIEEKVSFEEKPVVKTELSPYLKLDIKTEPSPDVKPEPSSKRFKTGPDYLVYEPPLEKKAEAEKIEEKVSFEEKPVVKTELSPYLDIKTEPSPDVQPEPSSKRFKTGPDYLVYEPPLEKKAEAEKGQGTLLQAKDTQIAKLLEENPQRLKREINLLQRAHQKPSSAEKPASSISPAKPFKPEQNKVFRSDLVRPGEHRSVKMSNLLIPTFRATPVTIGRDVYLAGGVTDDVKTEKLVQVYNMDSGDCRTLPPSPQYRSAAVAIDGTVVLIGGYSSSTHKTTNMVSTWIAAEERWTQALPPMKMKKRKPCVLVLNNHLFVFGGIGVDGKILLDSFEVLDLNNKQWTEGRGGLPQPLHSPQLGVFGDCVMLYGGYASARIVSRVCYTVPVQVLVDSVTNPLSPPIHWTEGQPYTPYFESALLTTSQDAVLVGGDSGDDQVTRAIHRFSSSGSWEVIGVLSEPRLEPAVVAVSDRSFLVLGGHGLSDPFGKLEDVSMAATLLNSVELIRFSY